MFTKFFKRIIPDKKIIFIVDDNEVYAKSLQTFIQIHFPKIKEIKIFRIGEMCLMELDRNPSIVIMDYFLNSKYEEADNGLEIIKRIKAQKPQTNIIVLSVQEKVNVILEAIKQYDCIYVQKDQDAFNKVEQSIKEIFNRENLPILEQ
jgi:DNA-binding NarL/FixJ family response regulator